MSDEAAVETMNDVVSEFGQEVDAEMTWDNVEDTAPTIEASQNESEKEESSDLEDEWNAISGEEEKAEVEEPEEKEDDAEVTEPESKEEESEEEKSSVVKLDELPDDTKVMATVDGELQEITLGEYKNGISGEKAIAKRFTEYDNKEKDFTQRMDNVDAFIDDFSNTIKNESTLGGVHKMASIANIPAHHMTEALIRELLPEIERRYGLSDEELQLEYQTKENAHLKNESESQAAKYQTEQAQRELQEDVNRAKEAHNIENQEWNDALQALDERIPEGEELTVELVEEFVVYSRAESKADTLMESFNRDYKSNTPVMNALVDTIIESPDLDDATLISILEETFANEKKAEAEEAVDKAVAGKAKSKVAKKVKATKAEVVEVDSWDDL